MKKTLIAALAATCLLFACEREETIEPVESLPEAQMSVMPQFRGIYIDGLYEPDDGVYNLADTYWENEMFTWVVNSGFNHVTFYGIKDALEDGRDNDVALLVKQAHLVHGLDVSFATAGTTGLSLQTAYYNAPGRLSSERQDDFTTEYEFWKTSNAFPFSSFLSLMSSMTAFTNTTSPTVKRNAYVYKFRAGNLTTPYVQVAEQAIPYIDRVFYANYYTGAEHLTDSMEVNLQRLATAAYNQNTTAKVIMLFNVRSASSSPDIFSYFDETNGNHVWDDAWRVFMEDYESSTIQHKENLQMLGYQIYRYTEAREARPNP